MDNALLILSILNGVGLLVIGYLQWYSNNRRSKSGEALDWTSAMQNVQNENRLLREDLKQLRNEFQIIKDLARRLIKNPPEKGEAIVISPIEKALLDTGPRIRVAEQ